MPSPTETPSQGERGGALKSSQTLPNGLTVNIRMGRLDDMPRCKVCGRALCHHSDLHFAGLATEHEE